MLSLAPPPRRHRNMTSEVLAQPLPQRRGSVTGPRVLASKGMKLLDSHRPRHYRGRWRDRLGLSTPQSHHSQSQQAIVKIRRPLDSRRDPIPRHGTSRTRTYAHSPIKNRDLDLDPQNWATDYLDLRKRGILVATRRACITTLCNCLRRNMRWLHLEGGTGTDEFPASRRPGRGTGPSDRVEEQIHL